MSSGTKGATALIAELQLIYNQVTTRSEIAASPSDVQIMPHHIVAVIYSMRWSRLSRIEEYSSFLDSHARMD